MLAYLDALPSIVLSSRFSDIAQQESLGICTASETETVLLNLPAPEELVQII